MPATRASRSRRHDQDIHEALVAGHTPAQVAAQLGLSLDEVQAAEKRVRAANRKLDPEEEARQRMLLLYRVVAEQSMQAWQRSVKEGEESTLVSRDGKDNEKAQRTTHKQAGDPRYLDRAMRAMAQEARLRGMDQAAPKTQKKTAVDSYTELYEKGKAKLEPYFTERDRKRIAHPRYQEFVNLCHEMDTGLKPPPYGIDHPIWQHPVQDDASKRYDYG